MRSRRPRNSDGQSLRTETVAEDEVEDEEQLHPCQRRRTSPREARVDPSLSLPSPREDVPLTLSSPQVVPAANVGNGVEAVPETPVATLVVGSPAGPSWLRSNFVIPGDKAELSALCKEIEAVSPPVRNLPFTNQYLSAHIGRVALSIIYDLNFLSTIEGVSSSEATHRARTLMARVSVLGVLSFLSSFFIPPVY